MIRAKDLFPLLGVVVCFLVASAALYATASSLSSRLQDGALSFPKSVDELRSLSNQLQLLMEHHYYHIVTLYAMAYLYKQTFAIPGSVFMNILAGALFGLPRGLLIACLLTATGATCCYLLSASFGRRLVWMYFKDKIAPVQKKLSEDHGSLLFLLISLRLFPMSPNWLLNLSSPLLGVPIHLFFLSVLIVEPLHCWDSPGTTEDVLIKGGVLISGVVVYTTPYSWDPRQCPGLIPYNLLCVQAGLVLSELQGVNGLLGWRSLGGLGVAAVLLLGTSLVARQLKNMYRTAQVKQH